jgi:hypothetical protein
MTGYTQGGTPTSQDQVFPLQGTYCYVANQKNKTGLQSIGFDYGSSVTIAAGECIFMWQVMLAGDAIDSFANGGYRLLAGDDVTNFKGWKTGGNDFARNPYGGWQNVAVDPTYTADYTGGTQTIWRYFASALNMTIGISKGDLHGLDATRYGRGEVIIEYGETADYGTFAGIAAQNDNGSNRWGLFQAQGTGYLWKGLLSFGNSTNACDFRDSGAAITIDDCPRTYAAFNKIEINNASSRVDWTTVSLAALGTLAPGAFEVVDNADVNFDSCTFTDMSTFILQANTAILNSIWQSCGLITAAGADLTGSKVLESTVAADASAVNWNVATDPDGLIDSMEFTIGSNAHHAIEFGTSVPSTMTIRNCTFTGFNAADTNNDSTFYFADTGGTITLNCVGCTGNLTYKSAGATIVIVPDPVTVKVTVVDTDGTEIENARVFAKAKDGTGPFPFEETVTISNSGVTATVTHTSHGMASNDYVNIDLSGSPDWKTHLLNDGVFQITYINANSYSYTMTGAPGSSPSGTIKATFVALYGLTDANGVKSTSRVYATDQPLTGWVRNTPTHKTAKLFGDVDSADGYLTTAVLSAD